MSDESHKARVIRAMEAHYAAQDKKTAGPSRKNAKPEKLVEAACMPWMRAQGWDVQIVESKATWSPTAKAWRQQATRKGTTDCVGNTKDGCAVFVEFKALGKLATFWDNPSQSEFVLTKIRTGAFACVVDSVDRLSAIYSGWVRAKTGGIGPAKEFLMGILPGRRGEK